MTRSDIQAIDALSAINAAFGADRISRTPSRIRDGSLEDPGKMVRFPHPDQPAHAPFTISGRRVDQDACHSSLRVLRDIKPLAQGRGTVATFEDKAADQKV